MIIIRVVHILWLLIKHRCFWVFKLLNGYNPTQAQANRFVNFLENAGPSAIKIGQSLSTREDIFGKSIITALSKLQDRVEPFSFKHVKSRLEKEIGNLDKHFKHIDEKPIASASVAQVHRATLLNGDDVVIKVIRPNIDRKFQKDIAFVRKVSKIINYFYKDSKRHRFSESIDELEKNIINEQNLMFEASNMDEIRENAEKSQIENIYIPKIYWTLTTTNILVTEFVDAVSIRNLEFLDKHNINREKIVTELINFFYFSVIKDGLFHADWHAGNILISKEGKIIFVDFGLVGRVSFDNRFHLANVIHGFLIKDYMKTAQAHINAGWVNYDVSVEEFAAVCRSIMAPLFDQNQKDVSLTNLLIQLFKITKRFGMETQPELLLLQKNMLQLEGIGRYIYPQGNMWQMATPIINQLVERHINPKEYTKYFIGKSKNLLWQIPSYLASIRKYKNKLDEIVSTPKKPSIIIKMLPLILCALFAGIIIGILIK